MDNEAVQQTLEDREFVRGLMVKIGLRPDQIGMLRQEANQVLAMAVDESLDAVKRGDITTDRALNRISFASGYTESDRMA